MAENKKKSKGPIRLEAIVPFLIVTGAVALYFALFFDSHLRRAIEWGATQANGAEVNIGHLRTSFLNATFEMGGTQATDPKLPARNRFEIARVGFHASWDALLRGKLLVEHAAVTGISVNTERKSPGRVLPPPREGGGPGWGSQIIGLAKKQLSQSSLGDIARLLEGMDPAAGLKQLEGELKSAQHAERLKADLAQKEAQWKKALESIPSEKDLAALQSRISAIPTRVSNPAEVPAKLNEARTVVSEAESKVNGVRTAGDSLSSDVNGFGGAIGKIDELVKQDIADLEGKLKLPKLDAKSIAEQLFGPLVLDKVARVEGYVAQARARIPARKKGEPAPKPAPRAEGRLYEFPRQGMSYPRFWIRRTEISSTGTASAFGGDVRGELLDLASDQALTGKPMVLELRGDFAKQLVRDLSLRVTVDHRGENPSESLVARVGSYPVPEQNFSESGGVRFGIGKATGATELKASLQGERIELESVNRFSAVDYRISAENKILESTLKSVVSELPTFGVDASLKGTLTDPKISISSNLASAIEKGFARQLQAKVAEARQRLEGMVRAKVDGPRREVTEKYSAAKSQLLGQVEGRKKQAEALVAQAQGKVNELKSRAAAPQQKAIEDIKKKLPFGR